MTVARVARAEKGVTLIFRRAQKNQGDKVTPFSARPVHRDPVEACDK
jgi:hypothetical protein